MKKSDLLGKAPEDLIHMILKRDEVIAELNEEKQARISSPVIVAKVGTVEEQAMLNLQQENEALKEETEKMRTIYTEYQDRVIKYEKITQDLEAQIEALETTVKVGELEAHEDCQPYKDKLEEISSRYTKLKGEIKEVLNNE